MAIQQGQRVANLETLIDGVYFTLFLTNGLTYSDSTTTSAVTGADVLSKTNQITAAVAWDATLGKALHTEQFTVTNATGSTQSWDGYAIIRTNSGGTPISSYLEQYGNDVSGSLADGLNTIYNAKFSL